MSRIQVKTQLFPKHNNLAVGVRGE